MTHAEQIQVKFWAFHLANPHVYDKLRELALMVRRTGKDRYSIRGIFHRLRWFYEFEIDPTDDPEFGDFHRKLNDRWSPFYARMLMIDEPSLKGFFETRTAMADGKRRKGSSV